MADTVVSFFRNVSPLLTDLILDSVVCLGGHVIGKGRICVVS